MDNSFNLALFMLDSDLVANEALIDISGTNKIKEKIQNAFVTIVNSLIGFVKALINAITTFMGVFRTSFRACMKNSIVTDTFGYIDAINIATPFIRDYHVLMEDTRVLDQKINTTYSVMDGVKDSLRDNTIRVSSKTETRRAYHEQVILNMDRADDLDAKLRKILDKVTLNPRAEMNPKRYNIEVLERTVGSNLSMVKTQLDGLHKDLEVSRRLYQDKNFIYRMIHSEDIKRNETLLKHTSSLMEIVKGYTDLYNHVLKHVNACSENN